MARIHRPLAGMVVAITGAARGIGRATAALLCAHGARVALGDLDVELARQVADGLGPGAVAVPLDVTDHASFAAFLDEAERRLGPLDALVNNAGIMPLGPFLSESDDTARRLVDVNLHGVIIGSKLALQRFQPRGRGHLVNVASVAGKGGFAGGVTYCATKHAVVGLSEAIRAEVRGEGIDVSIVMPVVVNTELGSGLRRSRVRVVEPEDVARAIARALETGRVDVYVPRSVGGLLSIMPLLPRAVTDRVIHLLGADRVLADPDRAARAAYERRAAAQAPAAGPATTAGTAGTPAERYPRTFDGGVAAAAPVEAEDPGDEPGARRAAAG
ncbi:MAG TPA: SDR family oxidoreductase [Solirubrobacteraceae bacterium]|nr:SDR family oxidoreductase [Solirubrobacteraceae bacterium]